MPLVEIIKGERTSDEALARAFDLVRQINKTPIVVNDSRGFFTSRVIGQFLNEGVAMVGEGIEPASVEQAAAQAGYPAKILSLMDELTLTLPRKIRNETKRAIEEAGGVWATHPGEAVIDRMVDEFERPGRSGGAGFYEYDENGKRGKLWTGLREHFTKPGYEIPFRDMQERMLFSEAIDTVRLLEEGVLTSVADANIGSIMGIGFPAWSGGILQYINGYEGGVAGFVARARELAETYGERFAPPALLVEGRGGARSSPTPDRSGTAERRPQLLAQRALEGRDEGLDHHRLHVGRERPHRFQVVRVLAALPVRVPHLLPEEPGELLGGGPRVLQEHGPGGQDRLVLDGHVQHLHAEPQQRAVEPVRAGVVGPLQDPHRGEPVDVPRGQRRPARRSSSRRVIDSADSGAHEATRARWTARSRALRSGGSCSRYRSIAASVMPCRWSSSMRASRERCSGP